MNQFKKKEYLHDKEQFLLMHQDKLIATVEQTEQELKKERDKKKE